MRHNHVPDDLDGLLKQEDASLRAFADDLRAAFVDQPDPAVATDQLTRVVAAAAELAHRFPVPPTLGQRWRRRAAHVFGLTTVKLALGAGAAIAATSGFAATGSLPDPVQRVVSDSVARIGVEWPSPPEPEIAPPAETTRPDIDDAGSGPAPSPPPVDDAASPSGAAPPSPDEAPPATGVPESRPTPSAVPTSPAADVPTPPPPAVPRPPDDPASDAPDGSAEEPARAPTRTTPRPDRPR